ncbi:MAG: TolC family protein [Desulfobacterales bacterium]|nr:TolC family protein [Desulfobacterales bacterium]MBF0395329.1 TolC family protein [Desulfobacterales bacterium]
MFKKFIYLFFFLLLLTENIYSEDEPIYKLKDIYKIALSKSEIIKISQEDLYLAKNDKEKAKSVLIPRFSSFANYTKYSEKKSVITSISGTPISLETITQPSWAYSWGFRIEQSFTLNAKELTALNMASDNIKKSEYDLDTVKEEYIFSIASSAYDVLKASKALEIAEANVSRIQKHKNAVSIRMKLEEAPKTAMYRADAELSKANSELIQAKNGKKLAMAVLEQMLGLPERYKIDDSDFDDKSFKIDVLDTLKKEAIQNRYEFKSLNMQKEILNKQIKFNKGAYWPTVSLEGLYLNNDNDASTNSNDSLSLGLKLTFLMFEGGLRRAQINEVLSRQKQLELYYEKILKQISLEVEKAYLEILTQQSILDSLKEQQKFSNANYDAVTKQFKEGLSDSIDVIDANTLLVTSEKQLSDASSGYKFAILKLKRAIGIFLSSIQN